MASLLSWTWTRKKALSLADLVENIIPQSGSTLDATREVPRSGTSGLYGAVPGTHDQETRKKIAFIVLALIAVFYGATLLWFLAGWIDTAKFTAAIAGMSGIQALAAAAIGFYYGSKQD
jgi:CHASE2 domain-containing sensor protein